MSSSVRVGLAIGSFTVAYGLFTIAAILAARVAPADLDKRSTSSIIKDRALSTGAHKIKDKAVAAAGSGNVMCEIEAKQ